MTILCPSCHTRYRFPHGHSHDSDSRGQCSHCDEQFPLEQAPRTYVMLPPRNMPIGMDDPSLAAKVGVPAGSPQPSDVTLPAPPSPGPATSAGEQPDAPRKVWPGVLAMVLTTAAGARLAYHFGQGAPVAWSALGGALGVLVGWGCILWIQRKD